jgi:hypothetical protein
VVPVVPVKKMAQIFVVLLVEAVVVLLLRYLVLVQLQQLAETVERMLVDSVFHTIGTELEEPAQVPHMAQEELVLLETLPVVMLLLLAMVPVVEEVEATKEASMILLDLEDLAVVLVLEELVRSTLNLEW